MNRIYCYIIIFICLSLYGCCNKTNNNYLTTEAYSWKDNQIIQGDYIATAISDTCIVSNYNSNIDTTTNVIWKLKNDISMYPQYSAPTTLEVALYNMSLDEMVNAIEADSTLRTGAEWAGVWTRDVSYSIILSMAHMQTSVSINSLLQKINSRLRIIQDTGTGGAWPCSSDRVIWIIAAWEIYLETGNIDWLEMIYPAIQNSLEDDRRVIFDSESNLYRGETSFIDWREQSYPKWMQPVDIYNSKAHNTNVVYAHALEIASKIADILGEKNYATKYLQWHKDLTENIHKAFFNDKLFYHNIYLYGRNSNYSEERFESLGEALGILWDITPTNLHRKISENIPMTDFGVPVFYPYIDSMFSYHNNAIWPFVASYTALAYAKANNEKGVLYSIGSIYRSAALFCTNKENFEASSGDDKHTAINPSNMLWSLSGNIALIHKLIFGINYQENGLSFSPFVPKNLAGKRSLSNYKYRNSTLNITLIGYGNKINKFTLDGEECIPFIPDTLQGKHEIIIELSKSNTSNKINYCKTRFTPIEPNNIHITNDLIMWNNDIQIKNYFVNLNSINIGKIRNFSKDTFETFELSNNYNGEIQIVAFDKQRGYSFASEPYRHYNTEYTFEIEDFTDYKNDYNGYQGKGYYQLTDNNGDLTFELDIPEEGMYCIDFRYANGNGPINTDNKCCIRSLSLDNNEIGCIIMPQRGVNEWSDWGWTNSIKHSFSAGKHSFSITMKPHTFNMNITTNNALIDQIRLTKIN